MNKERRNTGNCSTGYKSTGNYSTGHRSTGDNSTGYRSTGNFSTGDNSTGNYSISNFSTGNFSTVDYSGFGAFNKPCAPKEWNDAKKPKFLLNIKLAEWVDSGQMTSEEKDANPSHETTGGYLKVYTYKEAWRNAWNKATEEDKELLYKLPNFDAEVFKEISGIDVEVSGSKRTDNELTSLMPEVKDLSKAIDLITKVVKGLNEKLTINSGLTM